MNNIYPPPLPLTNIYTLRSLFSALAMWDHITYHPVDHIFGATFSGDLGTGGAGNTGGGASGTMLVQELLPAFRGNTILSQPYPTQNYPLQTNITINILS